MRTGWTSKLRKWKPTFFRRREMERAMSDEIDFHIEARAAELMARDGISREEAVRRSRLEFGSIEKYKEEAREACGFQFLDELAGDIKFAFRLLLRSRAFAATAILSLGLGIGANTVIFSAINSLLLRELPVEAPQRIFFINHKGDPGQSFPNYRDIRDRNTVFSSLFMYRIAAMALEGKDGANRVWGYLVTGNYFESLGVKPELGRFFDAEVDVPNASASYAVLSYDAWQRHFGGDTGIVGQTVRINARPYTILGVTPRGFQGTEFWYFPEIWLPLAAQAQI